MRDARCCGLGGVYLLLGVPRVCFGVGAGVGVGVGTDAAVERKRGRGV